MSAGGCSFKHLPQEERPECREVELAYTLTLPEMLEFKRLVEKKVMGRTRGLPKDQLGW